MEVAPARSRYGRDSSGRSRPRFRPIALLTGPCRRRTHKNATLRSATIWLNQVLFPSTPRRSCGGFSSRRTKLRQLAAKCRIRLEPLGMWQLPGRSMRILVPPRSTSMPARLRPKPKSKGHGRLDRLVHRKVDGQARRPRADWTIINWAEHDEPPIPGPRTTSSSAACGSWPTARATASTTSACRSDSRAGSSGDGVTTPGDRRARTPTFRSTNCRRPALAHRQLLRAVRPGAGDQRHEQHLPGAFDSHAGIFLPPTAKSAWPSTASTRTRTSPGRSAVLRQHQRIAQGDGSTTTRAYASAAASPGCLYYDEPSNGRYLVHTGGGLLYTNFQDKLVALLAPGRRSMKDRS